MHRFSPAILVGTLAIGLFAGPAFAQNDEKAEKTEKKKITYGHIELKGALPEGPSSPACSAKPSTR